MKDQCLVLAKEQHTGTWTSSSSVKYRYSMEESAEWARTRSNKVVALI